MAIYRRSSRRPLIAATAAAAVVGLVVGFVLAQVTAPNLTSQIRAARADVGPIVSSLDVVRDEYPKLLAATPGTDPGGAESALARAQTTFTAKAPLIRVIDPDATSALETALNGLRDLVTARASNDQVRAAVDAAQAAARRLAGLSAG